MWLAVTRTCTYRVSRLRRDKRAKPEALFSHLTWLRNEAVWHCRQEGKTQSFYDLCKTLSVARASTKTLWQWGRSPAQRAYSACAGAMRNSLHGGSERPRLGRPVPSFETDQKPVHSGRYGLCAGQGRGAAAVQRGFAGRRGGQTRAGRTPLDTDYEVQVVVEQADAKAVDVRPRWA